MGWCRLLAGRGAAYRTQGKGRGALQRGAGAAEDMWEWRSCMPPVLASAARKAGRLIATSIAGRMARRLCGAPGPRARAPGADCHARTGAPSPADARGAVRSGISCWRGAYYLQLMQFVVFAFTTCFLRRPKQAHDFNFTGTPTPTSSPSSILPRWWWPRPPRHGQEEAARRDAREREW